MIKVVNTSNKPKVTETTADLVVKKAFEVAGDQEHKQVPVTEGQFEFVLKRRKQQSSRNCQEPSRRHLSTSSL